jgi:hypothetical protein
MVDAQRKLPAPNCPLWIPFLGAARPRSRGKLQVRLVKQLGDHRVCRNQRLPHDCRRGVWHQREPHQRQQSVQLRLPGRAAGARRPGCDQRRGAAQAAPRCPRAPSAAGRPAAPRARQPPLRASVRPAFPTRRTCVAHLCQHDGRAPPRVLAVDRGGIWVGRSAVTGPTRAASYGRRRTRWLRCDGRTTVVDALHDIRPGAVAGRVVQRRVAEHLRRSGCDPDRPRSFNAFAKSQSGCTRLAQDPMRSRLLAVAGSCKFGARP